MNAFKYFRRSPTPYISFKCANTSETPAYKLSNTQMELSVNKQEITERFQ